MIFGKSPRTERNTSNHERWNPNWYMPFDNNCPVCKAQKENSSPYPCPPQHQHGPNGHATKHVGEPGVIERD
jgi:hypothetical protein